MDKRVILIVDDVESNLKILKRILEHDYFVKTASNGYIALEMAASDPKPDLVLLDVSMPEMDGYEVLEALKKDEVLCNVPVIFITGKDSTEDEEKGLLSGAVDYITKPVRASIVKARVRTHIMLKIQKDELREMALHDRLTGLYNRHFLTQAGYAKFARAKRHQENLTVVLSDLDHFKSINDKHGHLVGDKVLTSVGKAFLESQRLEDHAARYGGEEFIQIFEHCDKEQARLLATKLKEKIAALDIGGINITASFGIAQMSLEHHNFEELVRDADKALYCAKRSGRDRVEVFES